MLISFLLQWNTCKNMAALLYLSFTLFPKRFKTDTIWEILYCLELPTNLSKLCITKKTIASPLKMDLRKVFCVFCFFLLSTLMNLSINKQKHQPRTEFGSRNQDREKSVKFSKDHLRDRTPGMWGDWEKEKPYEWIYQRRVSYGGVAEKD